MLKLCNRYLNICIGTAIALTIIIPLIVITHTLDNIWLHQEDLKTFKQREISEWQIKSQGLSLRNSLIRQLKSSLAEEINVSIKDGLLSCRDIESIDIKERLGRGVTKDVYRGVYKGRSVAVKMVTNKVEDIKSCWKRNKYKTWSECYVYANYKLMKEVALAMQLDHPNVVKVYNNILARRYDVTLRGY